MFLLSFWHKQTWGCIDILEGIFPFDMVWDRTGEFTQMNRLGLQLMANNRMDSIIFALLTSKGDFL